MCLVSFIPIEDGYVLSSNRDEFPIRDAVSVVSEQVSGVTLTFPQDTQGGSWIICSDRDQVVCLLNGAFDNHVRQLPYRISRGVMMKHFFQHKSAIDFFEDYDFWGIEPFTMVIVDRGRLYEFRWNGHTKHILTLPFDETHIWSSSTLYDRESQIRREGLLRSLTSTVDKNDLQAVEECHLYRNHNDISKGLYVELYDVVKTISHTQVVRKSNHVWLNYHNLLSKTVVSEQIVQHILK